MEWYDFLTQYYAELSVSAVLALQVLSQIWAKIKSKKLALDFTNVNKLQNLSKDEVTKMSRVVFDQVESFKNELNSVRNNFVKELEILRKVNENQIKENSALTNAVVLLASNLNVTADKKQKFYEDLTTISIINEQVKDGLKQVIDKETQVKQVEIKKDTITKNLLSEV